MIGKGCAVLSDLSITKGFALEIPGRRVLKTERVDFIGRPDR
jgi:hypothetical protein